MYDRRQIVTGGLGSGLAIGLAAPAIGQNSGTVFSLLTDRIDEATALAGLMRAASGGRFDIAVQRIHFSGRASLIDRVGSGEVDLYLASEDAFTAVDPLLGLFAALPMGLSPSELEAWRLVGQGQQVWNTRSARQGVRTFAAGDDGPQAFWSAQPLEGASTLPSGPIGSLGLGLRALRAIGHDTVDLHNPGLDLDGLAGIEGISLRQMVATGLLERFPYMTTPNAARPMAGRSLGMNLLLWHAFTEADQALLRRVFDAHHGRHRLQSLHAEAQVLAAQRDGLRGAHMPGAIWDAQSKAARKVVQSLIADGPDAARAIDDYTYFLSDIAPWSDVSEAAYTMGRRTALMGKPK